jgi:DNA polymerase
MKEDWVQSCKKCVLCETRKNVVWGEGNKRAKIVFVGEAPGGDEDRQGRPFVGRAGKVLDDLLEKAGIDRRDVYITNVVKCRPPGNRKPTEEEMEKCMPYLREELDEINSGLIVLLGSTATAALLPGVGVTRNHGKLLGKFFVSYHPSMAFHGSLGEMETDFRKIGMIHKALKAEKKLFLLDYDGTLVPIVKNPDDAVMNKRTKGLLLNLNQQRENVVAIVTGRTLERIRKFVGIDMIFLANHGFEFYGVDLPHEKRFENYRKMSSELCERFREISEVKGTMIENKGYGIALHYRNADETKFFESFNKLMEKVDLKEMVIQFGKKVVEFRPKEEWNKGKSSLYLADHFSDYLPIYIGDDTTDESAFIELKNRGITICVGKKETNAEYSFDNVGEVLDFLDLFVETKPKKGENRKRKTDNRKRERKTDNRKRRIEDWDERK